MNYSCIKGSGKHFSFSANENSEGTFFNVASKDETEWINTVWGWSLEWWEKGVSSILTSQIRICTCFSHFNRAHIAPTRLDCLLRATPCPTRTQCVRASATKCDLIVLPATRHNVAHHFAELSDALFQFNPVARVERAAGIEICSFTRLNWGVIFRLHLILLQKPKLSGSWLEGGHPGDNCL